VSGTEFLAALNAEQIAMVWPMIDADYWQRRFQDYRADAEYVREMLKKAGW
jgi:aminoglycoside phosphotransferase (APT) family kinase protein